ncbi:SEL1-like repeat protein [Megasphaera sp.]|uniref:SEL1-like repeat protein n=1 Tax=Megasphaera sp. TaxID=2023260 RepID=UPI003AAD7345
MTNMENQLTVVDGNEVFTMEEQATLNQEIDRIISTHKNNRQEINRLVFECTAVLTEADDASRKLENKGFFRRLIGGITGSNKRLQDKINSNMRAAQYASQVTLQKLAEQNLMTFDLLTAVNNKLNASVEAANEMFKAQFMMMGKFFLKNRRAIVNLNLRLNAVEKNVRLLNWQNSIEYLDFDGVEYSALDEIAKIVCLTRDFYELTEGKWSTSDLLLLKAAMGQIGVNPHQKVNYFQVMKTIADTPALQQRLLGNQLIKPIADPSYLISLGTLEKINALGNEESYVLDITISNLKEHGMEVEPITIRNELVVEYMRKNADINLNTDMERYDIILDLLFNLSEAETENLLQPIDEDGFKILLQTNNDLTDLFFNNPTQAFDEIHSAAESGDSLALFLLGEYYDKGFGEITINEKRANAYRKKSYEGGFLPAGYDYTDDSPKNSEECMQIMNNIKKYIDNLKSTENSWIQVMIGEMYYNGDVVNQSYNCAGEWFLKAMEKGNVRAQFDLGALYYQGAGREQNLKKAAELFLKPAELGYAQAQYLLGDMYLYGQGVEQSYEKGVYWSQKAAEKGMADAQNCMGILYQNGQGVEQSYEKAVYWYQKAAENGEANAKNNMGYLYQNGQGVEQSYEKAVYWYNKAAEQENPSGQYNLAYMYYNGYGVEQSYKLSAHWGLKAAEQGHIIAQNHMGYLYETGQGVEQSYEKAAYWYQKAAEHGDIDAQYKVGGMYENGQGVEQSYEKAAYWYQKVAEQGNADVQYKLGKMYQNGQGVEKSETEAEKWYRKAVEQGHVMAQLGLFTLKEIQKYRADSSPYSSLKF